MTVILTEAQAAAVARDWIEAWNSNDLERVLSHYTDDFEMSSPLIVERGLDPTGVLRGKAAVGAYWGAALAGAQPRIQFELIHAYAGVNTLVIHYRSIGRKLVTEILTFDPQRRVIRGAACYGPPAG